MEPDIPCIGIDVGVRGLELVLSSQDSSLKMWQLAPESRMQRGVEETLVSTLMGIIIRTMVGSIFGSKIGVCFDLVFFLIIFVQVF